MGRRPRKSSQQDSGQPLRRVFRVLVERTYWKVVDVEADSKREAMAYAGDQVEGPAVKWTGEDSSIGADQDLERYPTTWQLCSEPERAEKVERLSAPPGYQPRDYDYEDLYDDDGE